MANHRITHTDTTSPLEKVFLGLLLLIFGGIVLHAPLTVGLSTLFPDWELLIKSWKEILMAVALVITAILLMQKKQTAILKEPLVIAIGIYAGLHMLALLFLPTSVLSALAGLLIDLRYLLFFVLVYIAVQLYPALRRPFIGVGVVGALIVTVFALLQVFMLPYDILKYIGYSINTIVPYLTVDQNMDYIRINSTLRGPNPLGAYAVIVLSGVMVWLLTHKKDIRWRSATVVSILGIGGLVALWASYSRSALIAALVAFTIIIIALYGKFVTRKWWIVIGLVAAVMLAGLFAARDSTFISNVILHENPGESNAINSNEGHVDSLADGWNRMIRQPFGAGVGSTGSASLHGDAPLIIENQYLFIAHEVGWVGLLLFLMIFVGVMNRLWAARRDWLGLALFASGAGLAIVGLLLPVWVDETVAIVWWGLAGLVIGSTYRVKSSRGRES